MNQQQDNNQEKPLTFLEIHKLLQILGKHADKKLIQKIMREAFKD
jgi:hypothetical protein